MSVEATQSPSSSPAAAASYPRWVLLEDRCRDEAEGATATATADAKTVAACRTSAGDPICVSVRVAAPPAESRMCVQVRDKSYAFVMAAHGDSVLLTVGFEGYQRHPNYFVYSAGTGAAMRPSLSLLPPCYHDEAESNRYYHGPVQLFPETHNTGLVGRGEDDLVVASLDMVAVSNKDDDAATVPKAAELLLLRHGEWTVKRPMISNGEGKDGELQLSSWNTHKVVSVGDDGLMCWVQFGRGLLFSNVFDETPVLRHVHFPPSEEVDPLTCRVSSQDVCVTSDGTVKFVSVNPRCCCGSSGATHCRHSKNAYNIRTWALKMVDMTWVMDGMVDATELRALDAYKALPRVLPVHPIVSMDEPHVIFFMVWEKFYDKKYGDRTEWLILVDMKSKTLRSVYRYDEGRGFFRGRIFHPSCVSGYFNSSPCFSEDASSVRKSNMDSETTQLAIANDLLTDNNASNSKAASPEEKIWAALQEIPDLDREDMLKAYSILGHGSNGRRFRLLLGLPVNTRKDWLLMEIKTSEACSFCSACTAN